MLGLPRTAGAANDDYAGEFTAETCKNSICAYSTFEQTGLVTIQAGDGYEFVDPYGDCEIIAPQSVICTGTVEWYLAG
jgi:hypothetical protein